MCVTNYSQMYQCIYCNYIYIGCRCIKSIDYWNWVCTLIPVIPICLLHSLLWPSMRIRLLKCPSLVVVGHLNIWNPGGDLGVPAFLHRLTAASDLETSVVGTGGWIRDESSWAKGGWSWPQITWSHLILKGLLTSVDRLKKLHLNISQRFWSRSCLGACGDNFSTGVLWHFHIFGWLKTHVLPSGKLTVGPWKYPFF